VSTTYERVTLGAIERAEGDASGIVRGVIATEGEASDGHILSVKGGNCTPPAPMCFGHESWRQEGTVGGWSAFSKSKDAIRGVGQIELGGVGAIAEARADLAFMVDRKHFRGLSVRWEEIDPPVRRVNLSKDHPAFVDAAKETTYQKLYGCFFPTWRLLEASIVTLGADPACVIGRMRETKGAVRTLWRDTLSAMLTRGPVSGPTAESVERFRAVLGELRALGIEDFGTLLRACGDTTLPESLHAVEYGDGKRLLLPREAYDALTLESTQRLELALDLEAFDGSEDDDDEPEPTPVRETPPAPAREEPAKLATLTYDQTLADFWARIDAANAKSIGDMATRARELLSDAMGK